MSRIKQRKVVVIKVRDLPQFKVYKTVNCVEPSIDTILTEKEVQSLIDTDPQCTVEVIAWRW